MTQRVTVLHTVNGDTKTEVIVCGHASVCQSAHIGPGVVSVDVEGGPIDPDGWQLVHAQFNNTHRVYKEVKALMKDPHFEQPEDCTCTWTGQFEGEELGKVYTLTGPDRRCLVHGSKPRRGRYLSRLDEVIAERDLLGRQLQSILDLAVRAEAEQHTIAHGEIYQLLITDPADDPEPPDVQVLPEPLPVDGWDELAVLAQDALGNDKETSLAFRLAEGVMGALKSMAALERQRDTLVRKVANIQQEVDFFRHVADDEAVPVDKREGLKRWCELLQAALDDTPFAGSERP